ncbi:thiamine-phosphate kinase [candidate division KSB1 bacterium]|nr:thiamine-phosphate kinase [candidate division KSB1 bacterium]
MSEKTITEIGEFGLIDRIEKMLPGFLHPDLVKGIGDDTAIIRWHNQRILLVTCDIQIENQHFRRDYTTFQQLGRRAMAVNMSDIAAMGGRPLFALISLGLPSTLTESQVTDLYVGMQALLEPWSAMIIGGNLSHSERDIIIDITLIGDADVDQYILRNGAKPGDSIWVSGCPGLSAAGFRTLQTNDSDIQSEFRAAIEAHVEPSPRIELGQALATNNYATSMIDISDGIASDLNHICICSDVGALLNETTLPAPDVKDRIESVLAVSWRQLALHGGEDYELLFTVPPSIDDSEILRIANECNIRVTRIGAITLPKDRIFLKARSGVVETLTPSGWDHFKR